jgi:N-acetyl-beta-hexosaminidase
MTLGKRELARIERRLITTLTDACETAKGEIKGFTWLTHTADLNAFAQTLKVTWVFETLTDKKLAQASAKERVVELTAIALIEANIDVKPSDQTVRFDSEEECQRTHGGDWQKRLAQSRVTQGY